KASVAGAQRSTAESGHHGSYQAVQLTDRLLRRDSHREFWRVSHESCSPIRIPSMGTSVLMPRERSAGSRPSRYFSPARKRAVSPVSSTDSNCSLTLAAHARLSLVPIVFSVFSYG